MKKQSNIQLAEVLNLSKIKKKCPEIIKHCDICEGTIIDHDNIPEEYIVDYGDRRIYSAVFNCIKCGNEVCENCVTTIDGEWEKLYVCQECYDKYEKRIKRILKMQKRVNALAEDLAEEIEEFLND